MESWCNQHIDLSDEAQSSLQLHNAIHWQGAELMIYLEHVVLHIGLQPQKT